MRKIFIVIKLVSIMLTVLFVHAISTQATPLIYTVDTTEADASGSPINSRLVQVTTGGIITDVGDLGFAVKVGGKGTIDLATLNGRLFGLHSVYQSKVVLHEINPLNGALISSVQLYTDFDGNPNTANTAVLHAEGLATLNGSLMIAFSPDPLGDYYSTALSYLALDGTIGLPPIFVPDGIDPPPAIDVDFDFDGLGSNVAGTKIYGLDVLPGVKTKFIGTDGFSTTENYVASAFESPNDLISIEDYLLAIDHNAGLLYQIDLFSKALTSVVIQGDGTYVGLASLNPVPEPTTVALLGIGLVGLAGAEVRRRRKKKTVDKN